MGRWFSYFLHRKECITIASTELKTSVTYEATGEQTVFNIPFDYLRNSFVKAKIGDDGEPMEYGTDYEVANRQITFTTAPVGMLYVYRETPTDRMVQFMEGSVLKATDMNISTLQQLHIIEENEDWTISNSIVIDDEDNTWEGRNLRIKNIADPLNAQDVVTKHYMETVQDGFVQENTKLKDEATKQANIATQQAQLATEKATTATQQANRAQAWAESPSNPDGEPDSKSSKTWAEEAAASAGSAAGSASTATTQAGIATTKASEAASSAASALSSKNEAATSASNAATSESNAAKSANAAATSASNAAKSESNAASSAQQAAETAASIGNPVASVTESGGTLTITKADGVVNTILQILKAIQDGNGNNIVNTYATITQLNAKAPLASNAEAHNGIFRGKNLGSSLTEAQSAAIQAGTFDDLYIGDYWTIGGVDYVIVAFDYYYNTGDTACTTHHAVIVPRAPLYNAQMNTSDVTTGAYIGSAMYKSNLNQAKTAITNAFGSGHLLTIRQHFQNAVTSDYESGSTWYDATVWLMAEANVYGSNVFKSHRNGTSWVNWYSIDNRQYPYFHYAPLIENRGTYWLRDVAASTDFAFVHSLGSSNATGASKLYGVRPAFCIKG